MNGVEEICSLLVFSFVIYRFFKKKSNLLRQINIRIMLKTWFNVNFILYKNNTQKVSHSEF